MATSQSPGILQTSHWRDVVALTFQVDDRVVTPFLPAGTRLAKYNDQSMVTLLARREMEMKVLGVPLTLFRSHLSIDLRINVLAENGPQPVFGYVVLRQMVSSRLCARLLRFLYKQPCEALRMKQRASDFHAGQRSAQPSAEYHWFHGDQVNHFLVRSNQAGRKTTDDSRDSFVLNQSYRFLHSRKGLRVCEVKQPPWVVWRGTSGLYEIDRGGLSHDSFGRFLRKPTSVYLCSGGDVTVHKPLPLARI